jgi:hypothetical protein
LLLAIERGRCEPDAVVDTCNPSYWGDEDKEDGCGSRPVQGEKVVRPPSQSTSWLWWCTPVIIATLGGIGRRIFV